MLPDVIIANASYFLLKFHMKFAERYYVKWVEQLPLRGVISELGGVISNLHHLEQCNLIGQKHLGHGINLTS